MTPFQRTSRRSLAVVVITVAATACSGAGGPTEDVGASGSAITPTYGVDYSYARPSPASIVAGGYSFVARYLSDTPAKDLSASEAASLKAAGLDIVCNWEASSTAALSGHAQGVSDATAAKSQAAADGQPTDRPIYFSVDFDASSSDLSAIEAYFEGVASVIGLSRTGAYGGYYIIHALFDAGKIKWGWQTYAWSGGQWDSRAQFRQIENGIDNDEEDKDEAVVADFGQWGPGAPDAAPRGYLDTATCSTVGGWAQDTSVPTTAINADVYFNGAAGSSSATGFRLLANASRADLCSAIGSCDHAYSMATPRGVMDGAAHSVYAYGINPTSGGANTLLTNSPKSVTCAAPAIPAGDVKRHVTNPTILGDWKFDTFTDMAPYTAAKIAAVPDGVDFGAPPDLVQVSGAPAIYIVDGMYRRHVINPTSLAAWRFTGADVKPITAAALAALTDGPDWPAAPLLVKDPGNPAVYELDVPFPPPPAPDAGANDAATDGESTDSGTNDSIDSGAIVFADGGGIVIDGSIIGTPTPIVDGGVLIPPKDEDASTDPMGSKGKEAGRDEDGGNDEGSGSAQVGSTGGCSVAHTSGVPDASWLVVMVAGLIVRTKKRTARAR